MYMSTKSYELCTGALDDEELFVIEGPENWRSTPGQPRGARKLWKNRKKSPPSQPTTRKLHSLHCGYPSQRRTGMSANSGDELNLRHLHCSRDNLSLHDRRDVQPSMNCSTCTTGTSTTLSTRCTTGMSTTLSKNCTTPPAAAPAPVPGHSPEGGDTGRTSPPGNNSRGSVAHHRTRRAAPADPWGHPQR